jgi:hypothetical protein
MRAYLADQRIADFFTNLVRRKPMPNGKSILIQVPDFRTSASGVLSSGVDKAAQGYHDVTNEIIAQIQSGKLPNEGMLYAIVLLGQWRAANAVTTLIEHIDFQPAGKDPSGGIGRWGPYPAQDALVKIGTPAVNMVLDKLATEHNNLRRQLMCAVISDALGKRVADAMLRFRHEEERDPSHRANLDAAIRLLQRP